MQEVPTDKGHGSSSAKEKDVKMSYTFADVPFVLSFAQ
jgi:hypothetical protein